MTEQEIIDSICKVDGLRGMTVNERLFVSGLMDEYDKAKWNDKKKAKRILELICDEELLTKRNIEKSKAEQHLGIQKLNLENEVVSLELLYESYHNENKFLEAKQYDKRIKLIETEYAKSLLSITTKTKNDNKTCLITEIEGGIYLHTATKTDNSYSIKLENQILYCSLGFTFIAFDIFLQDIIWKTRPEIGEIFEFYDLEDDFLIRGELSIHRIEKNGKLKWSFRGRDIWVSIDGEKEVEILEERILLIDFEKNKYEIDFNGNLLLNKPFKQRTEQKKWWKIW